MRVYTINGSVIRNKLDDISRSGYFMGYEATTGIIIYWKPYKPFVIHRSHHAWFDEYNYHLSIEDKHTPGSLLLQQDPESLLHNSDLINSISSELDIKSTIFCDTIILTYEIELTPAGMKIGFNLLDDEYFTITYVIDTIQNSPAGQLPKQAKKNL